MHGHQQDKRTGAMWEREGFCAQPGRPRQYWKGVVTKTWIHLALAGT